LQTLQRVAPSRRVFFGRQAYSPPTRHLAGATLFLPLMLQQLRKRLAAEAKFIQPCLPSPAPQPPVGPNWIHEIKHDGYRMMARRDGAGIRLLTRNGHDWSDRFPLIVEAVNHLKIRSCLIDGEAVCCDGDGLASFTLLRHRRDDRRVFLYAFDLIELDGSDLRRDPVEERKAVLVKLLRHAKPGLMA
jgi:bifunctional non-homologous end joining protein LigD